MNGRPQPRSSPWWSWPTLVAVGVVLSALMLVMVWHRAESTSDFRDFWETGAHFRATGQLTDEFGVHNYLPFFSLFMVPWSVLPLRVAAVAFALFSLVLFALTVALVEILLRDELGPRPRAALLVAVGLAFPYVYACTVVGNVGLLLLFLVVAAWFLYERGHDWGAGVTLGLATLIKLLPAALIVFLLIKGRWRAALSAAAVIVVLGLGLPLIAVGPAETLRRHQEFYKTAVQGHSAYQSAMADTPEKRYFNNNAVPVVMRRLLTPLDGGTDATPRPLLVNLVAWPRPRVFAAYLVVMFALVGTSAVLALSRPRRWPPTQLEELQRWRGQFAVWCCLMLLTSPLVWPHYLPLAYWPLAVLADRAERAGRDGQPDRATLTALLLWLVGAVLLAWPAARAAGAQIAGVAVLWLMLVINSVRAEPVGGDQDT